jgi:hypothetical protein
MIFSQGHNSILLQGKKFWFKAFCLNRDLSLYDKPLFCQGIVIVIKNISYSQSGIRVFCSDLIKGRHLRQQVDKNPHLFIFMRLCGEIIGNTKMSRVDQPKGIQARAD